MKLTKNDIEDLRKFLRKLGAEEEVAPPYAAFRFKKDGAVVTVYWTGSIVFGGKAPDSLKLSVVKFLLKQKAGILPRIGCDEAGKGEYFGPLTVGCVCADMNSLQFLVEIGVRDSKKLSKDRILKLSKLILKSCKSAIYVLMPEDYNKLYKSYNNVNKMLDDIYIENISKLASICNARQIVVDKFSNSLKPKLLRKFKDLRITVVPRAESDPVVAAASILAKAKRYEAMKFLEDTYGVKIPEGNSNLVDAKQMAGNLLPKLAKLHFKVGRK